MITLIYKEIEKSISGRIEFMVFYNRIENLVRFYNFSQNNYEDYIKDKRKELKDFEKEIENRENRTINEEYLGEYTFTEYEMTITIKDELYGIERDFLEFQKMIFIILCYSEMEKLFDNFVDIHIGKNVRFKNLKEKILRLNNDLQVDLTELINSLDPLRQIRNYLVHQYDYWDSEILIKKKETHQKIKDIKNLNDEMLSNILNLIIEKIIEFEIEYDKKMSIIND
ncbi:hypothetical protein [Bacillus wiedmannii]|uniref:Cthe-2314-like HEPN domain-containing protein n=1 Tax=Bacillus wiedmannii TaxID=1890302 RepID=A0A242Z0Q1_9BACI|nr:hypothetical protein [Bacillus wiedmannii]MED3126828.1 hypothetical protein [Bacillus wiedmannii]OTX86034.1 hypothetical protein BK730_21885 [Bacillus wiedmannii]